MCEEDCRLALALNGDVVSAAHFLLTHPSFSLKDVCETADMDDLSGGVVVLEDPRDVSFARVMQRCVVTGATLPSGLNIPSNGKWIVEGRAVIRFVEDVLHNEFESAQDPKFDFFGGMPKKTLTAPLYFPQVDNDSDDDKDTNNFPIKFESSLPICHPPPRTTNPCFNDVDVDVSSDASRFRSFDPDDNYNRQVDSPPPLEGMTFSLPTRLSDEEKHLNVSPDSNILDKVMGFDDDYNPFVKKKQEDEEDDDIKQDEDEEDQGHHLFSREHSFTGSFTDTLPGAPIRMHMSKEGQLVDTLMNLGIGRFASERLVEDLGVRELSDFRFLRCDELAAVLEADGLNDVYDDDDSQDSGSGLDDEFCSHLDSLESNQCAVQLASVKEALLTRGIILGEAGPLHPNPDLVLTTRRESQEISFESTIQRVADLKEAGNYYMSKNMFEIAIDEYSAAVDLGTDRILSNQCNQQGDDGDDEMEHLMAMCLANRSLASLKLDDAKVIHTVYSKHTFDMIRFIFNVSLSPKLKF